MSSEKQVKIAVVEEIFQKINNAKTIVIAEYAGLSVKNLQDLRKELKSFDTELKIYKNRLFKIATQKSKLDFEDVLKGPNVYAFGKGDAIMPIKTLVQFAKSHDLLKLKVAKYEERIINADEMHEIASLPSYPEALTILARSMMGSLQMLSLGLHLLQTNQE